MVQKINNYIDKNEKKSEKASELKSSAQLHELQKASLKILCSLFCLPNHYKDAPFTSISSKSGFLINKLPTLTTYFEVFYYEIIIIIKIIIIIIKTI